MRNLRILYSLLVFLVVIATTLAESDEQIIVNSKDWQDVYSGSLLAVFKGIEYHYVIEETQAITMLESLNQQKRNALVIESKTKPFLFGYKSNLENKGMTPQVYYSVDIYTTNLDMAQRSGAKKFILIDDGFGYNALSVVPLAVQDKAFVLFVNKRNIDKVTSFLQRVRPESLLLFGRLDREVKEALTSYKSDIVNTGDRFSDNIEAMRRFYLKSKSQQIILTNGEFIEPGIMVGTNPIFFIGSNQVPSQVIDFLKNNPYAEVGIVVGNDLTQPAKKIRDAVGIKVLIKFAQGRSSQLLSLDYFPMPKYQLQMAIKSVKYNTLTKQLEVTYENQAPVPSYAKATSHDIYTGDSNNPNRANVGKVGDTEPFFIESKEIKTVTYPIDLGEYFNQDVFVDSSVIYGESPNSLERILVGKTKLTFIQIKDDSEAEIESVEYNKVTGRFEVVIQNKGENTVFARPVLMAVVVAGDRQIFGGDMTEIIVGEKGVVKIRASLQGPDFADNEKIHVKLLYGSRPEALIKSLERDLDLVVKQSIPVTWIFIAVLVLIILFLLSRQKRK
ncbi:MAG: cell wall-binding repeat-containing protein [Nanoarchaeota archaeon]